MPHFSSAISPSEEACAAIMIGNLRGIFYPQIDWGGTGPGYVETEFQLYTFLVSLLYTLFGEQLWLGRLVSLIFTLATMIVFSLLAQRILKRPAADWALAFFALSPLYIRYSVAFMPEATVLFFYVTALYLFCRALVSVRIGCFSGARTS